MGYAISVVRIVALVLTLGFPAFSSAKTCLEYEPETVSLVGRIETRVFPGPPNYESIQNGDEKDTSWVLRLSSSACVNGNTDDELNSESEFDIKEMQLAFGAADLKRYAALLDKRVVVTGTLYHAHTAHHRTRVLITVKSIKPVHTEN